MQQREIPQPMPRRGAPLVAILSVQVVAGFALGAGAGYLGSLLGGHFAVTDPAGFGDIVAMLVGLLLGFPLGISGGVWLSGRLLGDRGALWATILGAYLGVGVGLIGVRLLSPNNATAGWLLLIVLSLFGACVGYRLRQPGRRHGSRSA